MVMPARTAILAAAALTACGVRVAPADHHEHGDEPIGAASAALSDADPVSLAVEQSCTTSVLRGLSTQLIEEAQCLRPGTFASMEGAPGFVLGSAVFPWLQTPARDALLAAQKERGAEMTINSALRTLPQQYLLYRWYREKRCGIGLAAEPGKSNHESALAVDIADSAGWRPAMSAHGFEWLGPSDPVHFDYAGEGKVEIGGLSVRAFQRLWNRNHPEDPIAEDGDYGPATEERLAKAPVGGFPRGSDCTDTAATAPGDGGAGLGAAGARRDGEGDGCGLARGGGREHAAHGTAIAIAIAIAGTARRRQRRPTRD